MRTITYYYEFEDEEELDDRQISLNRYLKIPRLKRLDKNDSFIEEWLEPNRHASA